MSQSYNDHLLEALSFFKKGDFKHTRKILKALDNSQLSEKELEDYNMLVSGLKTDPLVLAIVPLGISILIFLLFFFGGH